MDATILQVEVTGYGRMAEREGSVFVGQTRSRYGAVPGKAVRLIEARDWDGLFKLYRRSSKLRLGVELNGGLKIACSYGHATLAHIPLPEGCWRAMPLREAFRAIGVEMPACCGTWG